MAQLGILHKLLTVLMLVGGSKNRMQINTSSAKFSNNGLFSEEIFREMGIPGQLCGTIKSCANHSLANTTWSTYRKKILIFLHLNKKPKIS